MPTRNQTNLLWGGKNGEKKKKKKKKNKINVTYYCENSASEGGTIV